MTTKEGDCLLANCYISTVKRLSERHQLPHRPQDTTLPPFYPPLSKSSITRVVVIPSWWRPPRLQPPCMLPFLCADAGASRVKRAPPLPHVALHCCELEVHRRHCKAWCPQTPRVRAQAPYAAIGEWWQHGTRRRQALIWVRFGWWQWMAVAVAGSYMVLPNGGIPESRDSDEWTSLIHRIPQKHGVAKVLFATAANYTQHYLSRALMDPPAPVPGGRTSSFPCLPSCLTVTQDQKREREEKRKRITNSSCHAKLRLNFKI